MEKLETRFVIFDEDTQSLKLSKKGAARVYKTGEEAQLKASAICNSWVILEQCRWAGLTEWIWATQKIF